MDRPLLIGDRLTATGFRLPGIRVVAPQRDKLVGVFERGLAGAPFVLITAELARALPEDLLLDAIRAARPPVAIVPDARGLAEPPDLARRVHRALGIEQ